MWKKWLPGYKAGYKAGYAEAKKNYFMTAYGSKNYTILGAKTGRFSIQHPDPFKVDDNDGNS